MGDDETVMTGAMWTGYVEFMAGDAVPPNLILFVEPLARRLCLNTGANPDERVKLAVLAAPMTDQGAKTIDPATRVVASIVPNARRWMRFAPEAVEVLSDIAR
jgi:hypothetical protein